MIKVGVGGSNGHMGSLIIQALEEDPKTECTAKIDRLHSLLSFTNPLDVFIDFTSPDAVMDHLKICAERRYPMVIGVTGFSDAQKQEIKNAVKSIPIVFSPNMSIGINLCYKLLELAAKILKGEGEVAIHEVHHKRKKDMPSGTALRMGEIISESLTDLNPLNTSNTATPVHFASSRVGEIMGDHTVLFALEGERIEIVHRTQSRMIYAKGAVMAAKWLLDKRPGLYDMQDVLQLRS